MGKTLHKRAIRHMLPAALLAMAVIPVSAGVLPHYILTGNDSDFSYLENGTQLKCSFEGSNKVLFSDGTETSSAFTGPGFPIGFDFRYGGREFDTFVLTSNGSIILGNDGEISFDGKHNFYTDAYGATDTRFYFGCVPVRYSAGDKSASISYHLDGEAGERVLTVEFRSLKLNEIGSQGKGIYSTQLRLHESDGSIDMILHEEETAYSNAGFIVGLWGWGKEDVVLGTAKGLAGEFTKSPTKSANQLVGNSYVSWDPTDFMVLKTRCYTFTPDYATEVSGAPVSLIPEQEGNQLTLTVTKATDAASTLLMMSDEPFSDSEWPQDGVSYPSNAPYDAASAIGGAVVLCHSEDPVFTVTVPDIEPGKSYYFRAISSDGYPIYSRESLDYAYVSSQKAPSLLTAYIDPEDMNTVILDCEAEASVMIASTPIPYPYYNEEDPFTGDFGNPGYDLKPGDDVDGGGMVIYVGDPCQISVPLPMPNRPVYYRAWTTSEGRVSATSVDAHILPPPTIPYDPAIETWSSSCTPEGWSATGGSVSPDTRFTEPYQAVKLNVGSSKPTVLISPELPMEGDMKVTFSWSLESQEIRDAAPLQSGLFGPKGYAALYIGFDGAEQECWRVTEYNGEMEVQPSGNIYAGSSEMVAESITVRDTRPGMRLQFEVLTLEGYLSQFYISGLKVEPAGLTNVSAPEQFPPLRIVNVAGGLRLESVSDAHAEIYTPDGRLVASIPLTAGEEIAIDLPKGVYIVNRLKIAVK